MTKKWTNNEDQEDKLQESAGLLASEHHVGSDYDDEGVRCAGLLLRNHLDDDCGSVAGKRICNIRKRISGHIQRGEMTMVAKQKMINALKREILNHEQVIEAREGWILRCNEKIVAKKESIVAKKESIVELQGRIKAVEDMSDEQCMVLLTMAEFMRDTMDGYDEDEEGD